MLPSHAAAMVFSNEKLEEECELLALHRVISHFAKRSEKLTKFASVLLLRGLIYERPHNRLTTEIISFANKRAKIPARLSHLDLSFILSSSHRAESSPTVGIAGIANCVNKGEKLFPREYRVFILT